jgi:hypothetical protein
VRNKDIALRVWVIIAERIRLARERDPTGQAGLTSLEIAIYAAMFVTVATALALLISTAVGTHDANVK